MSRAGTSTAGGGTRGATAGTRRGGCAQGRRAPQVVVPQAGDQLYWAARVAELCIGAAHDGPTPTTESLSAALRTTLTRARATAGRHDPHRRGDGGRDATGQRSLACRARLRANANAGLPDSRMADNRLMPRAAGRGSLQTFWAVAANLLQTSDRRNPAKPGETAHAIPRVFGVSCPRSLGFAEHEPIGEIGVEPRG
jgi:hypothetical protein